MIYRIVILFCFLFCTSLWANNSYHYYGSKIKEIENGSLNGDKLKIYLHAVLDSFHLSDESSFDQIVSSCESVDSKQCYHHLFLNYDLSRKKLFGHLYLKDIQGDFYTSCVYCQYLLGPNDFLQGPAPGINIIPNSKYINTEHTWPQSKFSPSYPLLLQKSDLHALYPTSPSINTTRNNLEFGEVQFISTTTCPGTKVGFLDSISNIRYFEPPDNHKGNVARSIFYFSVRYDLKVPPVEEFFLKKWHELDPVDEFEKWKHEEIFKIQKVRNPFVDHPWMVDLISDF